MPDPTVKTAISLKRAVFRAAERFAKARRMSRSEFFAQAAAEYLRRHGGDEVTRRLNESYAAEPKSARRDKALAALAYRAMKRDPW